MLLQFITVTTIGSRITDRPLADTASVLLGNGGATFTTIAVLISTYGWISAALLYGPRLAYSLGAQGDFPPVFARLHPRFHTPAVAILFYAFTGWALASTGTYLWIVALGSGSIIVLYVGMCASLIRLRRLRPNADALRIPFGPLLSILAIAICLLLITALKRRELLLMGLTALIATANWLWSRRHRVVLETNAKAAAAPVSPL